MQRLALLRYLREESGATAIEYALIAILIALGILAALGGYGSTIRSGYDNIADSYEKARLSTSPPDDNGT